MVWLPWTNFHSGPLATPWSQVAVWDSQASCLQIDPATEWGSENGPHYLFFVRIRLATKHMYGRALRSVMLAFRVPDVKWNRNERVEHHDEGRPVNDANNHDTVLVETFPGKIDPKILEEKFGEEVNNVWVGQEEWGEFSRAHNWPRKTKRKKLSGTTSWQKHTPFCSGVKCIR